MEAGEKSQSSLTKAIFVTAEGTPFIAMALAGLPEKMMRKNTQTKFEWFYDLVVNDGNKTIYVDCDSIGLEELH